VRAALAICHDDSKPREARLAALQFAFFAPGHDPSVFLDGWSHAAIAIERQATAASPRAAWWHGGSAPILDLQAALDPFRPPSTRSENVDEFGSRVTVTVVADASHALIPEQPETVAAAIADWSRTLP
jgi:pimeloyl-ACP methyl ester carboxylesterase